MPSLLSPRVWALPAAIATTPRKASGTFGSPELLCPQATTVPSLFSATLWLLPAATATTLLKSGGTFVCPFTFEPHATTVPIRIGAFRGKPTGLAGIKNARVEAAFESSKITQMLQIRNIKYISDSFLLIFELFY